MTRESETGEPAWKGILLWGSLILIVTGVAFWLTIIKGPNNITNDKEMIELCSAKVLTDVAEMEPSRLMREGQIDDAIGNARDLINKDKWNVRNLMCAGNVFAGSPEENGLNDEGFRLLDTSTYLCPQSKYVRLNYARALARGNRYEEAIKQYDKVVSSNMDTVPSIELARLYLNNDYEDKATDLLDQITKKEPENTAAQKLLGVAMARSHHEKEGYEEYIQALGKERITGYPLEARELVLKNHENIPDAIKEQKAIADSSPNYVEPKLLLAEMLLVQNRVPEAKVVLDAEKAKFKAEDAKEAAEVAKDSKSASDNSKSTAADTKSASDDSKSTAADSKSAAGVTNSNAADSKAAAGDSKSAATDTKSASADSKSAAGDTKSVAADSKSVANDSKSASKDDATAPKATVKDDAKDSNDKPKTDAKDAGSAVDHTNEAELHRLYAELYHHEGKEDEAYQEWLSANTIEKQTD